MHTHRTCTYDSRRNLWWERTDLQQLVMGPLEIYMGKKWKLPIFITNTEPNSRRLEI